MVKVIPTGSNKATEHAAGTEIEVQTNGALLVMRRGNTNHETHLVNVAIYAPTEWRSAEVVQE